MNMKKLPKDFMFGDQTVWSDNAVVEFIHNLAPFCLSTGDYMSLDTNIYHLFKKNDYKYLIFGDISGNPLYVVDAYNDKKWAIYEVVKRWF